MIIGIVGKANVGKSTFFKALTLADVEIANYPFATIKPNEGVGFVRVECVDEELGVKCQPREGFCRAGFRFVPVKVIDVAGLVPGAHEGKGLGTQFLNDLNQADALIHVVDASGGTSEKGEPLPPGSRDPSLDVKFLEVELDFWYLDVLRRGWERFLRKVGAEHLSLAKAVSLQMSGLGVSEDVAKECLKGFPERLEAFSEEDLLMLARSLRKATKPILVAANKMDVPVSTANLQRLKEEFPDLLIIGVSAEAELALKEADKKGLIDYVPGSSSFKVLKPESLSKEQSKALSFLKAFLERRGSTGVQEALDKAVFQLLGFKAVFPGGVHKLEDSEGRVLPDCFLLPREATALDFAYKLHSDIGDNFVKAIDVKKKIPVGKEHVLNHRDVVEVMFKK